MSSISPACQTLKDEYDACFNSWFSEHFLKGDTKTDMCTNLFKQYQACIKVGYNNNRHLFLFMHLFNWLGGYQRT